MGNNDRAQAVATFTILSGLALFCSFGLGRWFGKGSLEEEIAKKQRKIQQQQTDYNSLKESATNIATSRDLLEKELEQLKMDHAQREIALALLRKYGQSELAEKAVFGERRRNAGNVPSDILCNELDAIVDHAKSGYLERIIFHKIVKGDCLEKISRQYGVPIIVIENFNRALFNGEYETTVNGMSDVRGSGAYSKIHAGDYLAIPSYRSVAPLPPAPPAPEAKPLPPSPPAPPAPEEVEEPQ